MVWCLPIHSAHPHLANCRKSSPSALRSQSKSHRTTLKVLFSSSEKVLATAASNVHATLFQAFTSSKPRSSLQANSSGESGGAESSLSLEEARQVLGIPENATFEQTVQAKNKLLNKVGTDAEKKMQVIFLACTESVPRENGIEVEAGILLQEAVNLVSICLDQTPSSLQGVSPEGTASDPSKMSLWQCNQLGRRPSSASKDSKK